MARFSRGWVKAWREQVDGDLPQNIWLWGIWHWLLLAATWKPTIILWNGKQRKIPPGTVVMGLAELSTKWDCSKNTVKKWLNYLQETDRISIETCTRGTIITIRNWDVYQATEVEDCTPTAREVNADCTPTAREVTLSKEVKKEEEKKEEIQSAQVVVLTPSVVEHAVAPSAPASDLAIPKRSKFSESTRAKMRAFISAYAQSFKAKYEGHAPENIRGNKALIGKIGHWIEYVPEVRAISLVEVYLQISYRPFNESYHDLWQFFRHLNRIGIALDTGKDANTTDWSKVFARVG